MDKKALSNPTFLAMVNFLREQPGSRPKVIAESLGVSRQYIHKLLAANEEIFSVSGVSPNRFYRLRVSTSELEASEKQNVFTIEEQAINDLIENNFYSLTPLGEELIGLHGFERWCADRKLNVKIKKQEYAKVLDKYYPPALRKPINFTGKLQTTFNKLALNKVWAADYYNFEIFGKTKLGTQVLIAKQTGDPIIMDQLAVICEQAVTEIRKSISVQALAFVSPTIQRQEQLMSMLEARVATDLPRIKIHKVGARILIAQKTLKTLDDRVLNAEQTFVVESNNKYDNVLIVDDALGSGATLQEIAKQILYKKIAKKCYGLALVASPSGYEVIQDV